MTLHSRYTKSRMCVWAAVLLIWSAFATLVFAENQKTLRFSNPQELSLHFSGPMGDRIESNLNHWLLTAPDANPGMIEMFHRRDRNPEPSLVPWAGEFVGKYLISAIQARRMIHDPRLNSLLRRVVGELVESQADDGYLGPFKKSERLLGHWDLWGHYHCMLALLMWYEETGDVSAKECAVRAANLICKTYLDTDKRILDMGSHEMNMAIVHVMGRLYRTTNDERYLRLMRKIEKEWEESGDYFRTGLAGVDFYKTPRPRWESLHDIQGILELYRITGNEDYKTSFINIWKSIARFDRHNTGGFTTFEQAIGNPYTPGPIETCCTIAWAALTVDTLLLTGDSKAADELEWSTWNGILGAQHPSGRWWTYDTPMDGVRQASAHSIVFQARAGTPELNCCSVNAPRGLGMLSEWACLTDPEGLVVNYYGPVSANLVLQNGASVRIVEETAYPADNRVVLKVYPDAFAEFSLRLRIPQWSPKTKVKVNGESISSVEAGDYLAIRRLWNPGDRVEMEMDFSIRAWIGDGNALGKTSLYYGPLLLAFDSHFNEYDTDAIPPVDLQNLSLSKTSVGSSRFEPLVLFGYKGRDGRQATLCDFATAGAYGTPYASWLPAVNATPPPVVLKQPANGEVIPSGPVRFEWSGVKTETNRIYTLTISDNPEMENPIVEIDDIRYPVRIVDVAFDLHKTYYWQVKSRNLYGEQIAKESPYSFTVDPSRTNPLAKFSDNPALLKIRDDGLLAASPLDGDGTPGFCCLVETMNIAAAKDRFGNERGAVRFSGNSMLRYAVPFFPAEEYTFSVWVRPESSPRDRLSQIISAWARSGDDPLRVVLEGDRLFGRIEGFTGANTKGQSVAYNQWMHIATVKTSRQLLLYINGERVEAVNAPVYLPTIATDFALGANPHFQGNEYFVGCMDDFSFYAKAMSGKQIEELYKKQ